MNATSIFTAEMRERRRERESGERVRELGVTHSSREV